MKIGHLVSKILKKNLFEIGLYLSQLKEKPESLPFIRICMFGILLSLWKRNFFYYWRRFFFS